MDARGLIRLVAGILLGAGLVAAGWFGWQRFGPQPAPPRSATVALPVPEAQSDAGDIVTVDEPLGVDPNQGATPMAQRVAVIGLLNKRNNQTRDLTLKPGQAVRIGDAIVRLRACERTAPWEPEPLTGAFLQLDVRQLDGGWRRVFSGWTFKERPALNVVQHPVYDTWVKSCTMTFPSGGGDSEPEPATRSSAPKSAAPKPDATAPAAAEPDSAASSNAM